MNENSIYPGEYNPPPEVHALVQELKLSNNHLVAQPLVNIDEYQHFFKIECVIYGVSREEILITADDDILSVTGISKNKEEDNRHDLHEFNHCCFNRQIVLPKDTDPDCIIAEYRSGILTIYVPKSTVPLKSVHSRIVVY